MIEVIIDGANVASINGTGRRDPKRIEIAIGQLDPKADCVKAVLPSYWFEKVEDPDALKKLVQENKVLSLNGDDDYYMIKYCVETKSFLLTNDKLRDHRTKDWWTPKHKEWAKNYLLDYEIIKEKLLLSENSEKLLNQATLGNQNSGSVLIMEVR